MNYYNPNNTNNTNERGRNNSMQNNSVNTIVSGNSITVDTNCDASEIKADIKVSEYDSLRLWGQVINCNNQPVPNVLVKLARIVYSNNKESYQGIAHTISDCNGFYQFEVCRYDKFTKYKVIVSKAAIGEEMVIHDKGDCDPCEYPNPCSPNNNNNNHHHHNHVDECYSYEEPKKFNCGCDSTSHKKPSISKCNKCGYPVDVCKCNKNTQSYYTASNQSGCHY